MTAEQRAETAATPLPDGRFVLPGNRWDLVAAMKPAQPPTVSVVVTHFDAQRQLDRILQALSRQTHPSGRLEVIVADDGSPMPPILNAMPGQRVSLVRQADAGFRAAAARNLGARAATGDVLCFLDVDTVPGPGYVQALTRLPALVPDALVTGRRRHADLSAMTDERFAAWLDAGQPASRELPEPHWLGERHRESDDLLRLAPDSYRFVISAVMACTRSFFDEVSGFDESFVRYGGEDWEFAHRALCAGAVLAHVADAVAWHDGPGWAERGDAESRRQEKNLETMTLTAMIPGSLIRGRPWSGRPDVTVEIDTDGEEPAAVAVCAHCVLLGDVDAGIWLRGENADVVKAAAFALEPRVAVGPIDQSARANARVQATFSRPLRVAAEAWPLLLPPLIAQEGSAGIGRVRITTADGVFTLTASRAIARADRWSGLLPQPDLISALFGQVELDAAENGVTAVSRRPDLEYELSHLGERRRSTG